MNWNYISKQTIDFFLLLRFTRHCTHANRIVEPTGGVSLFLVVYGSVWSRFNEARSNPGWMKPVCSIRKKTGKWQLQMSKWGKFLLQFLGVYVQFFCCIRILATVDGRNPAPVYMENIPFLIRVQHHPRCLFGISWPSRVSPRQTPIPSRERSHIPYQPALSSRWCSELPMGGGICFLVPWRGMVWQLQ